MKKQTIGFGKEKLQELLDNGFLQETEEFDVFKPTEKFIQLIKATSKKL